MSKHDDSVSLRQMLDYAREAVFLIQEREKSEAKNDRVLHLALTRLMEILGEAATRIAPQSRSKYPNLPWRQIIGMRNHLVHGYDTVDWDILWDTITDDLPPLIKALDSIVGSEAN